MLSNGIELAFTRYAITVMAMREIPLELVRRVVANPERRIPDPNDPEVERFFARIPEYGGRALRVAVNTNAAPWRVVSVFFDRTMRGAL